MPPRYSLEVESLLKSQDQDLHENSAAPTVGEEASPNAQLSDVSPLTMRSPPNAPDARCVALAAPEEATLPILASKTSHKGKVSV